MLDQSVEASFRNYITFRVKLESESPIKEVRLLYRVTGLPATARGDAQFEPGKAVEATFTIDQRRDYLPPGSEISYWWRVTNEAGDTLKTEPQIYLYMDDRHTWQTLSNERLTLCWYRGDQDFGEALFRQANHTLDQIENEAGVRVKNPIKIFIYGSHRDLLEAVEVGTHEWTGGQAFTEHGVVVINVSPYDLDFGLIAVPHELTHIVIDQATDNPYGNIPRWLDEGLAVYMSGELDSPFRGYRSLVATYARQNRLMTLQTLSSSFPADPEQANQAYAQSGLVVEFIIQNYGKEAMAKLLSIFAQGSLYDDALLEALGVDTWGLDNAWRKNIGAPPLERPGTSGQTPDSEQTAAPVSASSPAASPPADSGPPGTTSTPGDTAGQVSLPCLSLGVIGAMVAALFTTLLLPNRSSP
ncbi:MAG: peptidase MA family metallohydrolase [Anaerolineae bacterium]